MKREFLVLILSLFVVGACYNLWSLRAVKIVHISSNGYGVIQLVVNHMPWTDRDKIYWFLSHREKIDRQYPLFPEVWHRYYITDFGEGFTNRKLSPHEDLKCFPEIQGDKNCIAKNYVLIVDEFPEKYPRFYLPEDDTEYQMTPEGKIVIAPPRKV